MLNAVKFLKEKTEGKKLNGGRKQKYKLMPRYITLLPFVVKVVAPVKREPVTTDYTLFFAYFRLSVYILNKD